MKQFKPSKQKSKRQKIIGFDIENYNDNIDFALASFYSEDFKDKISVLFYDRSEIKKYILDHKEIFKRSIISATNLSFDFFGTFFNDDDINNFRFCWRGSDLLSATTYIMPDNTFNKTSKKDGMRGEKLVFVDTMNYACMSVEKAGQILNIPKLKSPKCLGILPKNKIDWEELEEYNLRDSEISYKILVFFYNSFIQLGGSPKLTIASTSMSIFRTKYLKQIFFGHDVESLLDIFKSYYGGRTEIFERGFIEDYDYFDVNSLYPDCMREKLPDPNSIRFRERMKLDLIMRYEGMTKVEIESPNLEYPLLPYRYDGKLIFPNGTFTSWYTHIELREALKEGYKIKKIFKGYWFKKTGYFLKEFVEDLYAKRLEYKAIGSPMEYVVKIVLNSLYGKFAQKFFDRQEVQPCSQTYDDLKKIKSFKIINGYIFFKKGMEEPSIFCFPEWSSYITAYARIKMYHLIKLAKPVYVDTDSLVTKRQMPCSTDLGELKKEAHIDQGYYIKPKLYFFKGIDEKQNFFKNVKIKGVQQNHLIRNDKGSIVKEKFDYEKICFDLHDKATFLKFEYLKFSKFRESIRRGLTPNQVTEVTKELNLEDSKRDWLGQTFDPNELQKSKPIKLIDGIPEKDINKDQFLKENKIKCVN